MEIIQEEKNGITLLRPNDELDFDNTVRFRETLRELYRRDVLKIIIDMGAVDTISSYTVGVLVAFLRDFREKSGDLKVFGLRKQPQQTFTATRIDQLFHCFKTEEEALENF